MGVPPFAIIFAEYFLSVVAVLSVFVVISGFAKIVRESLTVSCPPEFLALIVGLNFPDRVGVPESSPSVLMLNPEGRPDADHVIGSVPADSVNCTEEYSSFMIPSGRESGDAIVGG